MSTLYIVRHGQAWFGSSDYDRLSETGKRQANQLAEYCIEHQLYFQHAFSGTLKRQLDTAQPILEQQNTERQRSEQQHSEQEGLEQKNTQQINTAPLSLIKDPAFNEFDFQPVLKAYHHYRATQHKDTRSISALMQDKAAFQRFYDEAMGHWIRGELENDNIPPWPEFKQRILTGLDNLLTNCQGKVLLVTSGGVIGVLMQAVLDLSDQQAINLSMQVHNSSVSKVFFDRNGRLSLSTFNTLSHLNGQDELVTYR